MDMLWFKQIVITGNQPLFNQYSIGSHSLEHTDIDAVDLILTNKDDTLSFQYDFVYLCTPITKRVCI